MLARYTKSLNEKALGIGIVLCVALFGATQHSAAFEGPIARRAIAKHLDPHRLAQPKTYHQLRRETLAMYCRLQDVLGRDRVQIGHVFVPNYAKKSKFENVVERLPIDFCRVFSINAAADIGRGKVGDGLKSERVKTTTHGVHGPEANICGRIINGEGHVIADVAEHAGRRKRTTILPPDAGFLFLGPINPTGHLYNLRDSAVSYEAYKMGHTADGNRNWGDAADHLANNAAYAELRHMLNPEGKAKFRNWYAMNFLEPVLFELAKGAFKHGSLKKSTDTLRAVILQGQTAFPGHMFWAGDPKMSDPRNIIVAETIKQLLHHAFAILVDDRHSGYGELGKISTTSFPANKHIKSKLEKLCSHLDIAWAELDGGFYPMRGSFIEHVASIFPQKKVYPVINELGTVDRPDVSELIERLLHTPVLGNTLRDIASLNIMRTHHQGHKYGYQSPADEAMTLKAFAGMFDSNNVEVMRSAKSEILRVVPTMQQNFFHMDLSN